MHFQTQQGASGPSKPHTSFYSWKETEISPSSAQYPMTKVTSLSQDHFEQVQKPLDLAHNFEQFKALPMSIHVSPAWLMDLRWRIPSVDSVSKEWKKKLKFFWSANFSKAFHKEKNLLKNLLYFQQLFSLGSYFQRSRQMSNLLPGKIHHFHIPCICHCTQGFVLSFYILHLF